MFWILSFLILVLTFNIWMDYKYNFKQTSFRDFSAVYSTILWIYTTVVTKPYCILCGEYYGVFFDKNFKELVKRKTYTFVWQAWHLPETKKFGI